MFDWKKRINNPTFWFSVALSICTPIVGYYGVKMEDFTTWDGLGDIIVQAIQNPYVVGLILVSLYNTVIDPTTRGVGD